jgi:hypothetical protein
MTTNKIKIFLICLFLVCSTCFGRCLRPSSGARNCTCSFSGSHPRYQPAAISVDNSCSCKYSYVILMIGERIARNMYSRLEINKSKIVALRWSSFIVKMEDFVAESPKLRSPCGRKCETVHFASELRMKQIAS